MWEYAPVVPGSLLQPLLGAYQGSSSMQLLVNILRAMRPFAASTAHLPGARCCILGAPPQHASCTCQLMSHTTDNSSRTAAVLGVRLSNPDITQVVLSMMGS